jgi:hypothetical protein
LESLATKRGSIMRTGLGGLSTFLFESHSPLRY